MRYTQIAIEPQGNDSSWLGTEERMEATESEGSSKAREPSEEANFSL